MAAQGPVPETLRRRKQLLKKLGVTIQNQTKARKLADEINRNIQPGPKPDMDDIVAEVKAFRSEQ